MSSSSSSCTTEERARAEAYAEAECDRINPRCRAAYRATIIAKVLAEASTDAALQRAFQARILDSAVAKLTETPLCEPVSDEPAEVWATDPTERRAIRERALLLAQMEREQSMDHSW